MKKHVFSLFILLMVPFLHACKKEQPEPSLQEILTKNPWRYYKHEFYVSRDLIESKQHNGKWIFVSSGDYFLYDDNGDLYEYGTWKIENDWPDDSQKLLVFDATASDVHQYPHYGLHVDKINNNELILSTLETQEGLNCGCHTKLFFKR